MISLLLNLASPAWADPAQDVHACLEAYDVTCAQSAADALATSDADKVASAELAFHLGNFGVAYDRLKSAGGSLSHSDGYAERLELFEKSLSATSDFVTRTQGDVTLRFRPGMDEVLTDEAFETLQASHDRIGPILGGAPPGGVRLELYPTAQRFIDASSLPGSAVRTTGVIALSKWTRLLVSSPRALGRGYEWKDTTAHEYIHYIVAWRTRDRAPVWLQEGIARSHESLWRQDEPAPLTPMQETLLADALATDTLVPLERMHPSMAFLSSAEEASLAFAQVSTMVAYLRAEKGPRAISEVLDLVGGGRDALSAVADVGAGGDVAAFMSGWRGYLGTLKLVSKKIAAAKVVLDGGGDEFEADPLLGNRTDLARFARLGDLLLDAKRPDAALVEYGKASPGEESPSPLLASRKAAALLSLGRRAEAYSVLRASIEDYPEMALTRQALGALLLADGNREEAWVHVRAGVDIDPFDAEAQTLLADLYASRGEATLADRHRRYVRLLQSAEPPPR